MQEFTVCICVYYKDNAKHFVEAINSVTIDQSVKPAEVVIVVDGPVYGVLESLLQNLAQRKIFKVKYLPQNVGHAKARQVALTEASKPWVAIMDADDLAEPTRFEKQIQMIADNPSATIVGGQIREFIDTPDNIVGERIVPQNDDEIKRYLKSRCPFNQMTVMMNKEHVLSVGGYIDWYCDEDYYLWIRLAEAGYHFINSPEVFVNVRVGKEMYRRRGGWKYFRSEARLQAYMLRHRVISFPRYLYNVAGRFAVQVAMPNLLRGFIFQKFFRKS